ncbi:hypothetical protein ACLQ24_15940 [Micromonospora sp. DT4]|uniref:hypothetical protein n=1 Tax=Micromonospora sp. DT4 TaxID=3393438 RepID=UPI003CF2EC87
MTGAVNGDRDRRQGAPERTPPRPDLAARQAELVAALVAGGPPPAGFAAGPLAAARAALLGKRAGEVARHWPLLAAGLGAAWLATFAGWAADRPTAGSLRDGWDLARALRERDTLPPAGAEELAVREASLRYDGHTAPRPRRLPAVARASGAVAVQVAGRVRLLRPAPRPPADVGGSAPDGAGSALWISD